MGNLIGGKDDKMSYKFKITRGNAILNFSEEYCQSRCELIESESFARVLKGYVHDIKRKKTTAYEYLREVQKESIDIVDDLRTVFRLLLVMDPKELASIYPKFAPYFRDMDEFTQVIEDIYLFWRRLQRYSVVYNEESRGGYQNVQFADAQANFEALVLSVYRSIKNKCIGQSENVLRQITAGVNAGLRVSNMRSFLPYEYRCLDNIPFIESVIIHPPFITYSKRNKRDGVFPETKKNPIEDLKFDPDQWFCYPAKVGDLLCFVYFNVAYMAQGVTLCNLFQLATEEEYRRYYSSFEYLPIAFTDIEMVFNEESHAVDWIFRYANQELARLEKLSLNQLLGKSFGSLFSNMDSKWLRSYERSALYGEVLELMDYSPEIDTNLKVICFPTFKGHCGCILFDLDRIKAVDSSNNVHKIWNTYLRNCAK